MHTPFVPFNILFTRAVQLLDFDDLDRLDKFTGSLTPHSTDEESLTHPSRLYKLLCKAARLYVATNSTLPNSLPFNEGSAMELEETEGSGLDDDGLRQDDGAELVEFELADWYHGNQQLVDILDNYNVTF